MVTSLQEQESRWLLALRRGALDDSARFRAVVRLLSVYHGGPTRGRDYIIMLSLIPRFIIELT